VEEALRRYNISYTMVGGFSFYERAEIKDMLGYLRLVRNPHDSMALQRVINTPARGIGKTTLETLERLALETGQSTWDALGAAIANRLIPSRALMAMESFRQLILDAQAMMDPDFAGKLADVTASAEDASGFDFGEGHTQLPLLDSASFSPFTAASKRPFLTMPRNVKGSDRIVSEFNISEPKQALTKMVEISITGKTWQISENAYEKLQHRLQSLIEKANRIGASEPRTDFMNREPLKIAFYFDPLQIGGWEEIGVIYNINNVQSIEQFGEEKIPDKYLSDPKNCEHCKKRIKRNNTYILKHEDGRFMQVGSTCIHEFLGDIPLVWKFDNPEIWKFASEASNQLSTYLDDLVDQDSNGLDARDGSAFRAPGDAAPSPS
jgi:hypothetical protein